MSTLISSIPIITLTNENNYSAEYLRKQLEKNFNVSALDDDTLSINNDHSFHWTINTSEFLKFYKRPPAFFTFWFVATIVLVLLAVLYAFFDPSYIPTLFGSGVLNWLTYIASAALAFILLQIPEVFYFTFFADHHVAQVDSVLHSVDLSR